MSTDTLQNKSLHPAQLRKKLAPREPVWCKGCGHYSALDGIYYAMEMLKIPPSRLCVVSGIGCSGRFPFFANGYGLHTLHGRALPVAIGLSVTRPDLTVIVAGGDGDGVGIGGGHLPHAARNNFNITYLLLDNSIYGLTKGQVSPTSPEGMKSATTPYGNPGQPLNPASMAILYGATFVARVFSQERSFVSEIITRAVQHEGFSLVHVLSPCVEFNSEVTYKSIRSNLRRLPDEYDASDKMNALSYAENANPVYEGIFVQRSEPEFRKKFFSFVKKYENKKKFS